MPNDILKTLEKYKQQQASLLAQKKTIEDSIKSIETELTTNYGPNWEDEYQKSLSALDAWSKEHATEA